MDPMPRLLIIGGAALVIAGLAWHYLLLGHLPGDIAVYKKNVSFYFPLGTSLLVSVVLTLLFIAASFLRKYL